MPFLYKILGYGGNGVLLIFGVIAFTAGAFWPSLFLIGLGVLNLYLIRKVDLYSREEVWLEAEVRKRELRRRIEEMDRDDEAGGTSGEPRRIPDANEGRPPQG